MVPAELCAKWQDDDPARRGRERRRIRKVEAIGERANIYFAASAELYAKSRRRYRGGIGAIATCLTNKEDVVDVEGRNEREEAKEKETANRGYAR